MINRILEMTEHRPPSVSSGSVPKTGRFEAIAYLLFAGAWTLWMGCQFYASTRLQTTYTAAAGHPFASPGEWSLPLDDVFIHFDFARAAARGFPFQWSEGNGYSSGGTSLLYPFVLALGYALGWQGNALTVWAALVACVCVFATLIASRRLFRGLPRYAAWLAPLALLSVGALSWTLYSGMEVALFLALWGGALIAFDDLLSRAEAAHARGALLSAVGLGLFGGLVVATRPEGAVCVAAFGLTAVPLMLKKLGYRRTLVALSAIAAPGVVVLIAHSIANRLLTGDSSAAGALVKLELHHPYLSADAVFDAWIFHVKYQVLRLTHYHLSSVPALGWIVWVLAGVALIFRATRRYAIVLWASAIAWTLVVALNGQVRWQNERYSMPALAWLLLAAALGAGALLSPARALWQHHRPVAIARIAVCAVLVSTFAIYQAPRYREQIWFFGRASRNIRDQHVRAGRFIKSLDPAPGRVLVGDAGAIPYMADLPALDIIGLGGYEGFPFARATRHGVAAALELIERMRPGHRPDLLALYPSWWDPFPLWFGKRVGEFPVTGNVICGGASKVLYEPDWTPFDGSGRPLSLRSDQVVVDELDLGDILSEGEHGYTLSRPEVSYVQMKILASPERRGRGVWDAGRLLPVGESERFVLSGLKPDRPVELVYRVAPAQKVRVRRVIPNIEERELTLLPSDVWQEYVDALREVPQDGRLHVELHALEGERVLYHVWAIQRR